MTAKKNDAPRKRKLIPLLYKTDMIQAMLDGRKTQTIRFELDVEPGDWIWAREGFWEHGQYTYTGGWNRINDDRLYLADFSVIPDEWLDGATIWRKKPSIHMPKSFCRILSEVVEVKRCRLQDITDEEAINEGVSPDKEYGDCWRDYLDGSDCYLIARGSFSSLWDSINGKDPKKEWKANPVVTMVKFKMLSTDRETAQKLLGSLEDK